MTHFHTLEIPLGRPIYLVGMMGAGKTTVGELLSHLLQIPFYDLDAEVEKKSGTTVAELFQRGEKDFRELEAQTLSELAEPVPKVVATGGGAPAWGSNLDLMLSTGVVVWLQAAPEILLDWLGDLSTRPLLARSKDAYAELTRLLEQRIPFYEQAHEIVDASGTPEEIASNILGRLEAAS